MTLIGTSRRFAGAPAVALTATLGLAAAAWVLAVREMDALDVSAARFGSFAFFISLWLSMMAAMMLPGAAPALVRRAHADGRLSAAPLFVGQYLAVWALAGVAAYLLYRPHETIAAGAVAIAAGVYELTPLKAHFRRRCGEPIRSGFTYGLCCVGSCIGLMLVSLSVMSAPWMFAFAIVVFVQKLLPARRPIDVPLALAIVTLGILFLLAPAAIPGFMPAM